MLKLSIYSVIASLVICGIGMSQFTFKDLSAQGCQTFSNDCIILATHDPLYPGTYVDYILHDLPDTFNKLKCNITFT